MGVEEISIPREIEADGYITRRQDLRSRPLERVTDTTANPTSECCYPRCEECKDYVSYKEANYCTVPMVITKQTWLLTTALITDLRRDIDEAREMVYDHILDEKSRDVGGNYSVKDEYLYEVAYYEPTVGWHETIATMKGIEKLQMEYMDVMLLGKTDRKVGDEP